MKNKALGFLLVIFGFLWLLGNLNFFNGDFTLIIVGCGFLTAYYFFQDNSKKRNIGFIIPGCITLMIGIHSLVQSNLNLGDLEGSIFFLFLGTAFWMIYFIHNYHVYPKGSGSRNWPAFIGSGLYAFSLMILLIEFYDFKPVAIVLRNIWPIALISAGLIIVFNSFKK